MSDPVPARPTSASSAQSAQSTQSAQQRGIRGRWNNLRRRNPNAAPRRPLTLRQKILRGVYIGLIVLLVIAIVVGSAGVFIVERTLPQVDGTISVAGLHSSVTVVRDQWGVPHIAASDLHDALFAQGYVTAQDRLFQMEFNRRVAAGRLAEFFGPGDKNSLIKTDEFLRTLGLYRAAQSEYNGLDPTTKAELQAYADGVNAFLKTHQGSLPLEFSILGVTPQPWSPVDSLAYGRVVALSLDSTWYTKYTRALLLAKAGSGVTNELFPAYPSQNPTLFGSYNTAAPLTDILNKAGMGASRTPAPDTLTSVQAAAFSSDHLSDDLMEGATIVHNLLGDVQAGFGSNDWVVDGTHTTTGQPLLANDPHLGINMPAIWYEVAIRGGGLDVIGFTFPGVPGVIIGHNDNIAWGVTNVGADNSDLYLETLDPKNHPGQYLYKGSWQPLQQRTEVINVRGGSPVTFTVSSTIHGPLLNSVVSDLADTHPVALKWTALQPGYTFKGFFQLDFANNWSDFLSAVKNISISQNFVYADTAGNIGYRMSGVLPIRPSSNDYLPVDGASGQYEWKGYVEQSQMPTLFNPPTHIIATANGQIVPANYPIYVTSQWDDQGYRARRIVDLLTAKSHLSAGDFAAIQADVYAVPSAQLVPAFVRAGQAAGGDAATAAKLLSSWDGQMTRDSVAATVYEVAVGVFLREAIEPLVGKKLYNIYISNSSPSILFNVAVNLVTNPVVPFFGAFSDSETASARDAAIAKALGDTIKQLTSQYGSDSSKWQWGTIHQATFEHPLASVWPLNYIFGVAPVARPGDGVTVNVGGDENFAADPASYEQDTVSSMREIIDLQNFDNSVWVTTTGESGQPFSDHYKDLVSVWDQNHYQQMEFTADAVAKADVHLLTLQPG